MADLTPIDRTPRRDAGAFYCPRCGVFAQQEWFVLQRPRLDDYNNEWGENADDSEQVGHVNSSVWEVAGAPVQEVEPETVLATPSREASDWAQSCCGACREYSTWRGARLMYPLALTVAPPPHEDMDASVKGLYREAGEVMAISPRAGTALARATLERLLKVLDPEPARDLATRIDRMIPHVSGPLAQMLTVIRHTGNQTLHGDDTDELAVLVMDPEQVEIAGLMFASINDLVDEQVTRPSRTQELFDKLPEAVRRRAERAAQAAEDEA